MKTRKHRKWYSLNGMLRTGKFEQVIDTPVVFYYINPNVQVEILATMPYFVCCGGNQPSVDKKTAKITGDYPMERIYALAGIHPDDVESVREQLTKIYNSNSWGFNSLSFRSVHDVAHVVIRGTIE